MNARVSAWLDDDLDDTAYACEYDEQSGRALGARATVRRVHRFWSEERLEILKQGYKDGVPIRTLAATLGTTPGAVAGKAYRLYLTHRHPPLHQS